MFNILNRNKKSVALDLKHPKGKELFFTLSQEADVIVEGFRPGVMDRLGLCYEAIKAVNPRIIYCSLSGFGQTGPYKDSPGHDLNYLAMAGMVGIPSQMEFPTGGDLPPELLTLQAVLWRLLLISLHSLI